MDNSLRKEVTKSLITVDKVEATEFQKEGTKTAQLRQIVKTKSFYQAKQIETNLQDNMFAPADYDETFKEQEFNSTENRVAFINVPEVTSVNDVLSKISEHPEAVLYRILSNHPILTTSQSYAIDQGLTTLEVISESQIVRYGKDHQKEGQLARDSNDKPQYRAIFYSNVAKADEDLRTVEAEDFYVSESIQEELVGETISQGQEI